MSDNAAMPDKSDASDRSDPSGEILSGVPFETWRRLYELAGRLKRLAPWRWIAEEQYFGVQLSGAAAPRLVTFLGGHGTYCACTVYPGWRALRDIQAVQANHADDDAAIVLEIPHLQVVYTERQFVSPPERAVARALGQRFRGKQDWIVFRSFRPGYLPWPVDGAEAVLLVEVLNQTLGIALRAEDDRDLLGREPGRFLVRAADGAGGWRDEWTAMPDLPLEEIQYGIDTALVARLKKGRKLDIRTAVDLVLSPSVIQPTRESRPQAIYLLVVMDADTHHAYGLEMLQALEGLPAMWAAVPQKLLEVFARLGGCPRTVEVRGERMMNVLRPLTELLPVHLTRREQLPAVVAFMQGMEQFIRQRQ